MGMGNVQRRAQRRVERLHLGESKGVFDWREARFRKGLADKDEDCRSSARMPRSVTSAGMRPFGLIARKSGECCSSRVKPTRTRNNPPRPLPAQCAKRASTSRRHSRASAWFRTGIVESNLDRVSNWRRRHEAQRDLLGETAHELLCATATMTSHFRASAIATVSRKAPRELTT